MIKEMILVLDKEAHMNSRVIILRVRAKLRGWKIIRNIAGHRSFPSHELLAIFALFQSTLHLYIGSCSQIQFFSAFSVEHSFG